MIRKNQRGFTFTELMIALGISSIVLLGINDALINQHKSYVIKEQIIDMQEGLRIAMNLMSREIRMAGFDPRGTSNARIEAATQNSIRFTRDIDNSGFIIDPDDGKIDKNEVITYHLYPPGNNIQKLGRKSGIGNNQPVVEHIESLDFLYTLADGTFTPNPPDPSQIRNIQITLTARAPKPDQKYPKNDGYRTRTLTTNVSLRN